MFGRRNTAPLPSDVATTAVDESKMSLADFRALMSHVNAECRGIGCGYSRRRCRTDEISSWLRTWAQRERSRLMLLPRMRRAFDEHLPDYFRDYSDSDRGIENEDAFRKVHQTIVAELA